MNKNGILWYEMLSLTTFTIVLIVVIIPLFTKGCSLMKKNDINEEQRNKFDILATQINALRIEDGEKAFPIKIDEKFRVETYGTCKKEQQPGIQCSQKPKICLRDITNEKANPYCVYVENTDFEYNNNIRAANGLKMKKIEKDKKQITRVYA